MRLSEVPYIFYEDIIEKVILGELASNVEWFDGAKEVVILKEFGDITRDDFDDKLIEYVVVGEGIENIGEYAFSKNDLISVTLPKTIKITSFFWPFVKVTDKLPKKEPCNSFGMVIPSFKKDKSTILKSNHNFSQVFLA